jgi:beta-lactamase regulating signal transducer with metallopeptidase domain
MTEWLLQTLLATSALALLVLLVREPVRRRFGSRVTYGLWLIPVARLFMPTLTQTVERAVPAEPFSASSVPLVREPLWMARVTSADASFFERVGGWQTILVAIWFAVAAALFLSRMIAFHRDRRAILASAVEEPRIGSVRIIRTPELGSPVALGIFDRIIAIPSDFERRYGGDERRLVLEHELAHHRSGDLVANLFAFVLLCLQWFNPLAWVAHAAFRFDQEAACDARVLDKATAADRADYGRAIAKAASGRALLFASALDRPTSLQRRLQSMLRIPNPNRRLAGRLMVLTAVAVALPLTASRAVKYLDVPERTATHDTAKSMPAGLVPAVALAAAQPQAAVVVEAAARQDSPRYEGDISISGDLITIDGRTKRWEDLTPAERSRVKAAVATARSALEQTHFDAAKMRESLAAIPGPEQIGEIQRKLARSQASIAESVRKLDEDAARTRAAGRQPDELQSAIRNLLNSVQTVDLQNASRAVANIDREKIAADVANAPKSIDDAKAELARIQARIDADRPQ